SQGGPRAGYRYHGPRHDPGRCRRSGVEQIQGISFRITVIGYAIMRRSGPAAPSDDSETENEKGLIMSRSARGHGGRFNYSHGSVSNALGTVNPIQEIIAKAHAAGALVLVDAAQSVPHLQTDVKAWDADFVAFSGHKMLAPSGVGVLFGKESLLDAMPPFLGGGSMINEVMLDRFTPAELPAKFEAGTPPIVGAISLTAAIDYLENVGLAAIHAHDAEDIAALAAAPAPGVPPWGRFRVAGLISERNAPYDWHGGWAVDDSSYRRYPETLRMYSAGLYGLGNTMPGWSPLHLSAHWEFSRGYPAWLGMANARYLVTHRALPEQLAESIHVGQVTVSRLRRALPRAWVVPDAVTIADGEARLRHMRSTAFDPRRQVVVERAPRAPPPPGTGFAPARVIHYEAERVVVDLPGRDGYLVLADTHAPGWHARVDGVDRDILLANHVFRAVPVTAGETRVEFDYRPRAVVVGTWLSGVAVLVWLGLFVMSPRVEAGAAGSKEEEAAFLVPLAWQISLVVVLYGIASETALWKEADDRMRPGQVLREALR
ncbi:MAG: aminotransferase class V-fold PLP-dependent enzyme, partial [Proteobacteria bacterium]|nr:aminotransferase class V-fold PLP-dependent enzyme [Pseudomonadota bacterium]